MQISDTRIIHSITIDVFGDFGSVFKTAKELSVITDTPVNFKWNSVNHTVDKNSNRERVWKFHQKTLKGE